MAKDLRNHQASEKKFPRRYKLYDRLHLSIGAVNRIIYALIGLIVLAVLWGMLIRTA